MTNIYQIMQMAAQLKSNPAMIGQFLLNQGRINMNQYNEIQQLNGNPQQIVNYLFQNGILQQGPMNNFQAAASQLMNGPKY